MGFEAMFPGRRLRHEGGESGNAQEWTAIDGIDLENNTFSVRRLRPGTGPAADEPASGSSD